MTAAYTLTSDTTIARNQGLETTNQDAVWITQTGDAPPPRLTIEGVITVIATPAYSGSEVAGVRAIGAFEGGEFTMAPQASITVFEDPTPLYGAPRLATFGIYATSSPNITLNGNITLGSTGDATGVLAPFSGPAGRLTIQQAEISAVSINGAAYGVRMENGGTFRNTLGGIAAHAHTVARGVLINGHQGSFYNGGIIEADAGGATPGGYGIAVEWISSSVPGETGSFINDGVLLGDYALVARADLVDRAAVQVFVNNGVMGGKLDLGEAPTKLINTRRIEQEVLFGGSDDLYDGHAGLAWGPVLGGDGDDTLIGGLGAETLSGGAGDDLIAGGGGADHLDGGGGINTLSFTASSGGVAVDLAAGVGRVGADTQTITGFQRVVASGFNDTVTGSAAAETIDGGAGDDSILAGAGDDSIVGGAGQNYLRGDDGNDSILGGAGYDNVNGNKGDDVIDGGAGGADWLLGGQGDDAITSHAGDAILNGNMGADTVIGGTGNETIRGGQGDDSIAGGDGNDWLSGDRGDDVISGGAGADSFYTFSGAGLDRVLDFHLSEGDRVLVAAGTHYTVSQVGADTLIDLGGGDRLVLVGVAKDQLTGAWLVEI